MDRNIDFDVLINCCPAPPIPPPQTEDVKKIPKQVFLFLFLSLVGTPTVMTAGSLQVNQATRFPPFTNTTTKVATVTPKLASVAGRTLLVRTPQAGIAQGSVVPGQVGILQLSHLIVYIYQERCIMHCAECF